MKIEPIKPATKTKPPVEIQLEQAKQKIRALRRELRAERAHACEMLAIQRQAVIRDFVCNCAPGRIGFLTPNF